jgi:hypothetical protein
MIVYQLWSRHHEGNPDLYCPIILCDACGKQIISQGNVYWLSGDARLWHTHKWPCSSYDRQIEAAEGKHVLFEELDTWLNQLRHNTFDREPLPVEGPSA